MAVYVDPMTFMTSIDQIDQITLLRWKLSTIMEAIDIDCHAHPMVC